MLQKIIKYIFLHKITKMENKMHIYLHLYAKNKNKMNKYTLQNE